MTGFNVAADGGTVVKSLNASSGGITLAGAISGATTIDGTGDLTMGTITMTGFNVAADGGTVVKSLNASSGGITTTGPITATNQTINSGAITCAGLNTTGTIILNPNNDIVNVSTSRITNCIDPTNPQDVATKNYVDTRTSTATLSSTLAAGNSAGSTSINMNSQPITNVSLISPPSTNQRFSVVAIEANVQTRNAAYPSTTAYDGQMCFLLDSKLMTYFITGSGWQTL